MSAAAAPAETRAFRATAAEIADMDGWVERIGTRWAIPERAMFHARVCIAEVAANVLEHGGTLDGGCDRIIITLRHRGPGVEIEVIDGGIAFNPVDARIPAPADATDNGAEGGRGLLLLHSYASQMKYRRERGQNILLFRISAT
jgi:anti-sigma regulatory factor (Ser/Thr protein kinase)